MKQNLLSCVIPLYNGKKYIKSCVNEILKINYKIEIIIVNDGSSDDSYYYCKDIFSNNENVKILTQDNGGVASARNYGISQCSGKYVIFIDQDDMIVPSTVEKAIGQMDSTDCDALFWSTDYYYEFEKNKPCDVVPKDIIVGSSDLNGIFKNYLMHKPNKYTSYLGHVWAGIYKRKIIEKNKLKFYKFVDYEDDFNFILNYLNISNKVGFISNVGYLWRVNLESYSRTYRTIDNFIVKSEMLYDNIRSKNRFLCFTTEEQQMVEIYWRQYIILSAIRNCTNCGMVKVEEFNLINNRLNSPLYTVAFKSKCLLSDKREHFLFYLIKYNLVMLAIYLVCIYFRLKK